MTRYHAKIISKVSSVKIHPHHWVGGIPISMEVVDAKKYKNIYGVKSASPPSSFLKYQKNYDQDDPGRHANTTSFNNVYFMRRI